ncbi:MAG: hypothetical protein PWQ57_2824 [Desulfovibrionales bacterium]|nr:hypothetical protein [Desulfovibrionales bacterium]
MLEVTKTPRTDGLVAVSVAVPADRVHEVERAIIEAAEPNIPADEVLKDSTPGTILRGARGLADLTQAQLAEKIGVHKSNVSEMERDKRPIGKEMARRLGEALGMSYKVFL